MAKPASPREPVSVLIRVHNAADQAEKLVPGWGEALARLDRGYEIVVVDDGSTDGTSAALEKLAAGRVNHLRVIRHDTTRGFGACLKSALTLVETPLLFYTALDYPYRPADLRKLLDRIDVRDLVLDKRPDLICGCRTGTTAPPELRWLGRAWRLLWRVVLGLQLEPSPSWTGVGGHCYRVLVGWVFGVPLADVNSAYKLYRTEFLKRIRIQSDGEFVHAELAAKATFLTSIIDEVPLTPVPDVAPPSAPIAWRELWRVFRDPEFGESPPPAALPPGEPGSKSPSPIAPVDGSRSLGGDTAAEPSSVPENRPALLSFRPT